MAKSYTHLTEAGQILHQDPPSGSGLPGRDRAGAEAVALDHLAGDQAQQRSARVPPEAGAGCR